MRVHVIQLAYGDDEPVPERVERVAALVRDQRGADLVVLPELWAHGGFAYRSWAERAEPVDGPTMDAMAKAARDAGVVLHAGSIVERLPRDAAHGADRGPQGRGLWNTSVVLGPGGERLATYRKIHRFGFGAGEPSLLEAGNEIVAPALSLAGADATTGLATCYDLRFPEMFRRLVDVGARLVLVPAAWPVARVEAWALLGRARAVEDQIVLVQCNTAGTHAGGTMGGRRQGVDATRPGLAQA